jgi:hypothetical protein
MEISECVILHRLTEAHFCARYRILTAPTHRYVSVGVMTRPRLWTGRPWNLVLIIGRGADRLWDQAIVSAYRGLLS